MHIRSLSVQSAVNTPTASVQRGKCPGYDIKQSNWEAPVMLVFYEMHSTPLLPSLPSSLWPRVEASDKVLSTGPIELFDFELCVNKWQMFWWIVSGTIEILGTI